MSLNFTEVTWPVLAIWGLGIVAVIIGFLIGYVDSNLRSAKLIEAAESKAEVIRTEADKKLAEAEALKSQIPSLVDDPGMLRLKNKNGIPMLELDGAMLNINKVSSDQKKRLIELLSVIRPWLEGGQPVQSTPQPAAVPTQTITSQTAPRPASTQPIFSSLSPSPTQPLPVTNLSEKEFKALSIIAQIDHVYQTRIIGTPYEGMGIRILEGAVGSVEVKIGPNKYPSIDDVPDEEIKKSIHSAIAEWEEKYTPGK